MLSFLSRFVGIWFIAAGLIAAIVDGAKSIAGSALVLTPLAQTWATLAGLGSGRDSAATEANVSAPWPLSLVLTWLATAPTVAVLAALGIFFLVAGRRRRSAYLGREFAA